MNIYRKQGAAGPATIIIFVVLIVGFVITNIWLRKMAGRITSQSKKASVAVKEMASKNNDKQKKKRKGDIIRKTYFSPDRKYEINIFYQGGGEVARNKFSNGDTYDRTGKIPDGKVEFIDETDKTYGTEYYRDQKRHSTAKIYYIDDVLKQKLYYQYGKKITNQEYYHDGILRMEENYTNAREYGVDDETGIGKVYFRDGAIKYEWHLTVTEPIGFKKSYNRSGRLVGEFYYDEYGKLMDPKEVSPAYKITPAAGKSSEADNSVIKNKMPKQIFIPAS